MINVVAVAVALLAVILLPWFLTSPVARLMVFVVGTMVTAGSSAGVTTIELGFIAVLAVLGVTALSGVGKSILTLPADRADLLRRGRRGALLLLALVIGAVFWGIWVNGSELNTARAAVAYLTVPIGVLVALDAGPKMRRRRTGHVILVAGVVTSIAFMVFFANARGLGSNTTLPVLPSIVLAGLTVALGCTLLIEPHGSKIVGTLGVIVPIVAVLASGTRSGLALVAAGFAGLPRTEKGTRPVFRLATWGATAWLLSLPIMNLVSGALGTREFVQERISALAPLLGSGLGRDPSGASRMSKYETAWNAFLQRPILGNGLGASYLDQDRYLLYLDTPLMYLAAFGATGSLILVIALGTVARTLWLATTLNGTTDTTGRRLLIGYGAVLASLSPLSAVMEDRGFAVALSLLVAFVLTPSEEGRAETVVVSGGRIGGKGWSA